MISGTARAKQVTDPFDEKARARISGHFSSSGSEQDAESSDLVDGFFFSEKDGSDDIQNSDGEEYQPFDVPAADIIRELLNRGSRATAEEQYRGDLLSDVSRYAENFSDLKKKNRSELLRAVMVSLREKGYDAGICRSRWENKSGVVAGSYEYVDVVISLKVRYIVDVEFAGEFDIARPTQEYERITSELPRILVTRPETLRQILRILAEAAWRSLRRRELSVPPWRKTRFMQAKWLGPYLRTPNFPPASSSSFSPSSERGTPRRWQGDVKCRLVGFDTAAFLPSAVI